MRKPPHLHVVGESEALVVRNVLPLKPAPHSPERSWRDLIRQLTKNPVPPKQR
jgi:hypothetical protein